MADDQLGKSGGDIRAVTEQPALSARIYAVDTAKAGILRNLDVPLYLAGIVLYPKPDGEFPECTDDAINHHIPLIANGRLHYGEREFQDGHEPDGTWVERLPGADGTPANFKGVFYRASDLSAPVDGDWIFTTGGGLAYAERYYTGGGSGSGWRQYDPVTSLGWDRFLNIKSSEQAASNAINGFVSNDDVFAIFDGMLQQLSAWTAGTADRVDRHWRRGGQDPVAIFWGMDQTERLSPTVDQARIAVGGFARLSFKGDSPDESFFGGEDLGIQFLPDAASIDLAIGEEASSIPSRHQFRLPAGVWDMEFYFETTTSADTGLAIDLRVIKTGTDDFLTRRSIPYATAVPDRSSQSNGRSQRRAGGCGNRISRLSDV